MRIVFFGTTDFAAGILRTLATLGHNLVGVVTQPDRPAGRGRRLRESPVKALASQLELRVETPQDPNATPFLQTAQAFGAELFVVVAYGHIFGPSLLAVPARGCINVHASLLPRYRGAAPIHHALISGEAETGITTIWMDERLDAGDIILQRALAIAAEDNVGTLERKLAALGAEVLLETLRLIEDSTAPRIKQEEVQATYAPALARAHTEIDWRQSAQQVCNLVRGTSPRPGAFTFHRGRRLKVLQARVAEKALCAAGGAGEVVETDEDGLIVLAGVGAVLLAQVQPQGKRPMSGAEYARGYRPQRGEVLGAGWVNDSHPAMGS